MSLALYRTIHSEFHRFFTLRAKEENAMEMIPEKLSENGYVLINRENIAKEVEKITDAMDGRR